MSTSRILGIVLLIGGIILIIIGAVASRSIADNLSSAFTGHFTHNTMWYIFGGIASAVLGLVLTLGAFGRIRS
jgi:hypothetical protein